ncbi:DUF952 domain-containing protein [Novosphingobium sp. Fuku2-ISO-50]|uniref:DUF952 domain-containing protein n=1 Tax=Novosphingobium sp. Fuku2-ISO-50 TaxID=1739114 RepID=UPI00076CD6D1|nr:hypothetical protein AQZ50_09050 [Novosphingobium sp. Fuku2-ISO-50]
MMSAPAVAFKILTAPQWADWQATGSFIGAPVDLADGYVHLSSADQLTETANKHFAGQDDLVVVRVDLAALGDLIRWEPSRGGALFPHVYGPLPLGVALAHGTMARDANGAVILP